jgi:hypothetical protein
MSKKTTQPLRNKSVNTAARNKAIEEMYAQLSSKKKLGAKMYSDEAIYAMIAAKFFLSITTVVYILTGNYRKGKKIENSIENE